MATTGGTLIDEWWVTNTGNLAEHVRWPYTSLNNQKNISKQVMKFERVLGIYWSKGFLCNGYLAPYHTPPLEFFKEIRGYFNFFYNVLATRFELFILLDSRKAGLLYLNTGLKWSINTLYSQTTSVNNRISELKKYLFLKLLLIKTTRGRAHALGKPSRGQRTWSNSWTAYNVNKTTRVFLHQFQKVLQNNLQEEKRNYKLLEVKKKKKSLLVKKKKLTNNWF